MKKYSLRQYIFAALFAALTAIGAYIRIPIPPVPFTLQTMFVFISGGLLGPFGGFLSQLIYVITGLTGLPIFAGGGGPGYILMPTFGFLMSYPAAGFISGFLSNKASAKLNDKNLFVRYTIIYSICTIFIFIVGLSYLALHTKYFLGKPVDKMVLVKTGFLIFIPTAILKILISAWLTIKLKKILSF